MLGREQCFARDKDKSNATCLKQPAALTSIYRRKKCFLAYCYQKICCSDSTNHLQDSEPLIIAGKHGLQAYSSTGSDQTSKDLST